MIGGTASSIIRERIQHLTLAIHQDPSASSQKKHEPMHLVYAKKEEILCGDYCNEMMPLLQMWKEAGLIQLPPQSENSDTAMAGTKFFWHKFPDKERLNLKWFCETVGCDNIESVDGRGWNPLHHLCYVATSCPPAMKILLDIGKGKDKMPDGDTGAHAVHQQRHAFPEEAGHTDAA